MSAHATKKRGANLYPHCLYEAYSLRIGAPFRSGFTTDSPRLQCPTGKKNEKAHKDSESVEGSDGGGGTQREH